MSQSIHFKEKHAVVIFDGVCNLCEGFVKFLIPRDKRRKLKYAPLQSDFGQSVLRESGLSTDKFDSFLFWQNGSIYDRSSGAIRAIAQLGGVYSLMWVFWIVPKPIRNFVYMIISRNRYSWFGKKEHCLIPTKEIKSRFID